MVSTTQTEKLLSKTYHLTEPWRFEEKTVERELKEGSVSVKPTLASVCHADLRYYTGQRSKEILDKKLPMALFHEGIGEITKSSHPDRTVGEKVIIIPNIPGYLMDGTSKAECCDSCKKGLADNYCERGVFMGSGYDGIAQEQVVIPSECALPIPKEVPDQIAVLSELCTVSYHAIARANMDINNVRVAVFGDGPVGYLTAAMLHYVYNVPKERLRVFGAVEEKLAQFTFAECHLVHDYDFSSAVPVDLAIECTGAAFSESAANQAIDLMDRGAGLVLMGVSENRVPLNTRDILEKGLSLHGSSRSSVPDYKAVMEAMKNPDYQQALAKILPDKKTPVQNTEDLQNIMNETAEHKAWKKTVIEFSW